MDEARPLVAEALETEAGQQETYHNPGSRLRRLLAKQLQAQMDAGALDVLRFPKELDLAGAELRAVFEPGLERLDDFLRRVGKLGLTQAAALLDLVARILVYLHKLGLSVGYLTTANLYRPKGGATLKADLAWTDAVFQLQHAVEDETGQVGDVTFYSPQIACQLEGQVKPTGKLKKDESGDLQRLGVFALYIMTRFVKSAAEPDKVKILIRWCEEAAAGKYATSEVARKELQMAALGRELPSGKVLKEREKGKSESTLGWWVRKAGAFLLGILSTIAAQAVVKAAGEYFNLRIP